jgi:uncharacterized protein YwgA
MDDRSQAQQDQLLVALDAAPLDRIRLMKTAFLVWYRQGRPSSGPFTFEPYLYGPCSFQLYRALDQLVHRGLVVQEPTSGRTGRYYLTPRGREALPRARQRVGSAWEELFNTAQWSRDQSFDSLLRSVYSEAPEYASQSVLAGRFTS